MLAATFSVWLGYELKRPCTENPWVNYYQYWNHCYSDIQALYGARHLDSHAFPYVEEKSYEYPVLTGLEMWFTARNVTTHEGFFKANVPVLGLMGLIAAAALIGAAGPRPRVLWFAAAPALVVHAFTNWDLLAVAPLAVGMYAWSKGRDLTAGAALGLGAAAKLFPGFAVPALMLARIQQSRLEAAELDEEAASGASAEPEAGAGEAGPEARAVEEGAAALGDAREARRLLVHEGWRRAGMIALGSFASWAAVNVPVIIADTARDGRPDGWLAVFKFHAGRNADFETVWYWILSKAGHGSSAMYELLPSIAALVMAGLIAAVCVVASRRAGRDSERESPGGPPEAWGVVVVGIVVAALLWWVASTARTGDWDVYRGVIDNVALLLFAGGMLGLLVLQWRRDSDPWATAAATVALFLAVSKVHSPQYALWLLPFFVVVRTPWWLIAPYLGADLTIFWVRYLWYAEDFDTRMTPWHGLLVTGVLVRAASLVALIAWWALTGRDEIGSGVESRGKAAAGSREARVSGPALDG